LAKKEPKKPDTLSVLKVELDESLKEGKKKK